MKVSDFCILIFYITTLLNFSVSTTLVCCHILLLLFVTISVCSKSLLFGIIQVHNTAKKEIYNLMNYHKMKTLISTIHVRRQNLTSHSRTSPTCLFSVTNPLPSLANSSHYLDIYDHHFLTFLLFYHIVHL